MSFNVVMPALGESVTEGTVTRWLKNEGDQVAVDEPLLEVSTDKVDTEIPSPVAGTVAKILVAVDQTVPVGAELVVINDGAAAPAAPAVASAPVAPAPVDPMAVAPAPVDPMAQAPVAEGDDGDEMVDLQELLDSLNDDESAGEEITEGEEEDEEPVDEKIEDAEVVESLQSELNEAMSTVQYLRDQLNEVNLLNAKLLYTNKLFNSFNLDQKQKLKVVETFDLAKSIREVKLSYTILSESYSLGGSVVKKTNTTAKTITEGLASKPVASTAPKKELIVENSNVMALRFQKLAGIKK